MTAIQHHSLSEVECDRITGRLAAIRLDLEQRGLTALLVQGDQDIRCIAGCFGHDTRLLITPRRAVLVSDRRYEEYLEPWLASEKFEIAIGNRPEQLKRMGEILVEDDCESLAVQSEQVTLAESEQLRQAFDPIALTPVSGLMDAHRQRKTPEEIDAIRAAIVVQGEALHDTLDALRLGMTEGQVAARLIYEMRRRGAESEAFEPIVGSGANASVIHHVPGSHPVDTGVLLIDWGARVNGLCSDLTRTFFLGEPDEQMARMYNVVAEAQLAAIAACTPGTTGTEVDAAARQVIDAAGWGDQFAHGVGHGLGRDVHERPFMGRAGTESVLETGMVVTIEPGIYLPGIGGVRIEDDILVTETGPEVLSEALDKRLETAILPIPTGAIES